MITKYLKAKISDSTS